MPERDAAAPALEGRQRLGPRERHGGRAGRRYVDERRVGQGRVHRLVEPERGRSRGHVEHVGRGGAGRAGARRGVDEGERGRARPGYPVAGEVGDRAVPQGQGEAAVPVPGHLVVLGGDEPDRKGGAVLRSDHPRPVQGDAGARPPRERHEPRVHLGRVDVLVQPHGDQAARQVDDGRAVEVGPVAVRLHAHFQPARRRHGVARQVGDRAGADVEAQPAGARVRPDRQRVLARGEGEDQGGAVCRRGGRAGQSHAPLPAGALDMEERRVCQRCIDGLGEDDGELAACGVQARPRAGGGGGRVAVWRDRQPQARPARVRVPVQRAPKRALPGVEEQPPRRGGRGRRRGGQDGRVPLGPRKGDHNPRLAPVRYRRPAERHGPGAAVPERERRRVRPADVHGRVERQRERPRREVEGAGLAAGAKAEQGRDA